MEIKKIISGGQTGADLGGLKAAKKLGILTGGTAPRGYRTEKGSNLDLKYKYNLREHSSFNYPPRTKLNIVSSDGTLLFGVLSGGSKLTVDLCLNFEKPVFIVPKDNMGISRKEMLKDVDNWLFKHGIQVLNIAGNRESKNPGIQEFTENFLLELFKD